MTMSNDKNRYFDHSQQDDDDQTLTLRMIAANMPDAAIAREGCVLVLVAHLKGGMQRPKDISTGRAPELRASRADRAYQMASVSIRMLDGNNK